MNGAGSTDQFAGAVRGRAAGVPFIALPPVSPTDRPGLALLWHGFSPPRSEEALAAALLLAGVPAWRVYLGLPLFGQRLVAGGVDEIMRRAGQEFLLDLFAPAVEGAVAELPRAHAELLATLKIDPQAPLGLFGFSAGGAAALLALASSVLPLRTVAVYGPIVDPASAAEENARYAGGAYHWTDASRAAAQRLRLEERADEIAGRDASLLVALGGDDWPALTEPALRLAEDVRARRQGRQGGTVEQGAVPGVGHPFVPEPGLVSAPQGAEAKRLDDLFTSWFTRQLTVAALS